MQPDDLDDIASFFIALREQLLERYSPEGVAYFLISNSVLDVSDGILLFGSVPLCRLDDNKLTVFADMWNNSMQLPKVIPLLRDFMAAYLPNISLEFTTGSLITHNHSFWNNPFMYMFDPVLDKEAEKKDFIYFSKTGIARGGLRLTKAGQHIILKSLMRDKEGYGNLCYITKTRIVASKQRATHLKEELKLLAAREKKTLVWKQFSKIPFANEVLYYVWRYGPQRDDSVSLKEITLSKEPIRAPRKERYGTYEMITDRIRPGMLTVPTFWRNV